MHPPNAYNSPIFITVSVLAFVTGVIVAFLIDESLIAKHLTHTTRSIFAKLLQSQLIFLSGNLLIATIGLSLLKLFAIPSVLGDILGGIASFPVSYFFSMRQVWPARRRNDDKFLHSKEFEARQTRNNLRMI